MINKNKLFRNIHIYVSLFFLPVALIYAFSGLAYILGADENTLSSKQSYKLEQTSLVEESTQILALLRENGIKEPSSKSLRADRKQGGLSMGGVHYSVNLRQEGEDLLITTTTRSLLGDIILLHKDKGEWYFRILSIGFGLSLILLYLSGLMISFFASKKDRKPQLFVLALGILSSVVLAYLSL